MDEPESKSSSINKKIEIFFIAFLTVAFISMSMVFFYGALNKHNTPVSKILVQCYDPAQELFISDIITGQRINDLRSGGGWKFKLQNGNIVRTNAVCKFETL